jgi:hypothetical protein
MSAANSACPHKTTLKILLPPYTLARMPPGTIDATYPGKNADSRYVF